MNRPEVWWQADKGRVHEKLLNHVHEVEQRHAEHFDRFAMLESMYDPNGPAAAQADPRWRKDLSRITENVIATNVDTVCSAISTTDVRARFMTDGADWGTQMRALDLGQYSEEIAKLVGLGDAARQAFFGGAKKGTGVIKNYADENDQLHSEAVPIDNIVVDDVECQNGASPRQLHYRQIAFDRDVLLQQFPDHADDINKAKNGSRQWARWTATDAGRDTRNDVLVIESWYLPLGNPDDEDTYVAGRHVICIDGADLLDEEWHKPTFPFSVFRWSEREGSFYGIGLGERIIGHQRTLNKRNWQRDRQLDQVAVPTTYVRPADINARIQTTQAGNFIPIKGDWPVTIVPQAVGNEMLADRHDTKASAYEETGVARMSATGTKPPGIDSGAGLRELRDQNTQRFSKQEKAFEKLWLDSIEQLIGVCKDLGKEAPTMSRQSRFGARRIKWGDVRMKDVRVQIVAASMLNRTPAGRTQMVLEFTQAGIFSLDDAKRLMRHPDLEQALSLHTAALEAIEEDLEMIERGNYVIPEPFINLKMAVWRAQNRYLVDRGRGAPEEILEGIRTYIVQAAHLLNQSAANSNALAGGAPGGMLPPGATPQQVPAAGPPMLPAGALPAAM